MGIVAHSPHVATHVAENTKNENDTTKAKHSSHGGSRVGHVGQHFGRYFNGPKNNTLAMMGVGLFFLLVQWF